MFNVGDHVVNPLKGVGTINEVKEIEVLGEKTQVYVINTAKMDLQVPVDKAKSLGWRPIISKEKVENIFKIIRSPSKMEPFTSLENWNERYEELKEKIKRGSTKQLAEVVRDLTKNSKVYELNIKEREILQQSKESLVQELILASGLSKTRVGDKIDEALKANVKKKG